ncbi:MAG TPA: hypothetical protein DD667_11505, partial [Gammaproteobacteria bacterium]|nr:hypothetical protein [Gammaproteobacteria bacterium]
MKTKINHRTITSFIALWVLLPNLLLLSGCGGDNSAITFTRSPTSKSLIFAYPYPGQREVTPSAQVVLRFSAPLDENVAADLENRLQLVTAEDDNAITFDHDAVDDNRGLVLRPVDKLTPNTEYQLQLIGEGIGG